MGDQEFNFQLFCLSVFVVWFATAAKRNVILGVFVSIFLLHDTGVSGLPLRLLYLNGQ